jgi:hypothetical protein
MKNRKLFLLMIGVFFLAVIFYSCEKWTDQSTTGKATTEIVDQPLTDRTVASCDQCPVGACCCSVESLVHSGSHTLRFCGTADGTPGCTDNSGPSPCNSISGGGQSISLNSTVGYQQLYCMYPGNAFSIKNLSGHMVTIILSCQYDLTHPQKDTISIADMDTVWFSTDSGCAVAQCQ